MNPNQTILSAKQSIEYEMSMSPEHQKWVIKGKILPNDKTFAELNIERGTEIVLMLLSLRDD